MESLSSFTFYWRRRLSISYSKAIHKSPETAFSLLRRARQTFNLQLAQKSATESAVQILEDFVVARRFISEVEKGKRNEEKRRVRTGESERKIYSNFLFQHFLYSLFCSPPFAALVGAVN
jgi:hypothetical protein